MIHSCKNHCRLTVCGCRQRSSYANMLAPASPTVQLACVAADPRARPTAAEIADTLSRTAASRRPSLPPPNPTSLPGPLPRTAELSPGSPPTPHPLHSSGVPGGRQAASGPVIQGRAASLPQPGQQQAVNSRRQSLAEAGGAESLPSLPSWMVSDALSPAASLPSPMRGAASPPSYSTPEPLGLPPAAAAALPVAAAAPPAASHPPGTPGASEPAAGEARPVAEDSGS